jgi:type I restriction-modification system DNA methylase subunit
MSDFDLFNQALNEYEKTTQPAPEKPEPTMESNPLDLRESSPSSSDEEDDGIPFEDKMADLSAILNEQMEKEAQLNQEIKEQLSNIGVKL